MSNVAVVTGASSGFGAEFARRFAQAGHDLVLVARRRDRMEQLARELTAAHGVTVTVIDADLAEADGAQRVADRIADAGLKPAALVNSAGFGTAERFADEDPARIADEIRVNVLALTLLSRLLMPSLLAAPEGFLINISSTAGHQPVPTMAVYGATKAYVLSLTEAIWHEVRGSGLRVLTLCPGPTETEFFEAAGTDRFRVGKVVGVRESVDEAWRALHRPSPPPTLTVGLGNRVNALGARLAPRRLTLAVTARLTARGGRANIENS
ncbi:SDR family oxidoreductase [Kineosporia sp. J2-2]|uniref:SDR family oxidoreductase n=1 Tax=Kineosporia corallincola TaxID=2835133 RepID=A0ABS5TMU6_9ACTN|nr:SDR family oxidoreductase [Kineosporia corallincola]MBT0771521.1 SDR family oxidoreductase [Kineosporia corallincola]